MAAKDSTSSFERITNKERITTLLGRIKDARGSILVHFEKNNNQFSSAILDINPKTETVVFDEILPNEGHDLLLKLKQFNVTARIDGVSIHFKCALKTANSKDEIASYSVQYPVRILYEQRRDSFRVPVSDRTAVPMTISTETENVYEAYLIDLSSSGIGAYVEENEELTEYGKSYYCKIHLPKGDFVTSEFELCFVKPDDKMKQIQIGGRFVNLSSPQRVLLERFIMTLQREAIKHKRD